MLRSAHLFQGAQMTVAGVGVASARKRGSGLPGDNRWRRRAPFVRAPVSRLLIRTPEYRGCHCTTFLQTELLWGFASAPSQVACSPVLTPYQETAGVPIGDTSSPMGLVRNGLARS